MYRRRYTISRTKAKEYADTMEQIRNFCHQNGIDYSKSMDSYYFTISGTKYRISNHTVEASNRAAYHDLYGQVRDLYHPEGREEGTIYITAGKTRIEQIYTDLAAGRKLDKRGNRI